MYCALGVVTIWAVSTIAYANELDLTTTGASTVTIPAGYEWTNVTVQCWGGGGGGGGYYGGGGGGGAYSAQTYTTPLVAGAYSYFVGAGGAGGFDTGGIDGGGTIWDYLAGQDVNAGGGSGGFFNGSGGSGGMVLAGTGCLGGAGGSGTETYPYFGGGGGGGAGGPAEPGGQGGNGVPSGGSGGVGSAPGGNGGAGCGSSFGYGSNGVSPGGGGGGGYYPGGNGGNGQIIITYTQQAVPEPSTLALLCGGAIGLLASAIRRKRSQGNGSVYRSHGSEYGQL